MGPSSAADGWTTTARHAVMAAATSKCGAAAIAAAGGVLWSTAVPAVADGWSRLFLCRHGQTASNANKLLQGGGADTELNSTGRAQAASLAAAFGPGPALAVIASSQLSRAVQTADAVWAAQPARTTPTRVTDKRLAEMLCPPPPPPHRTRGRLPATLVQPHLPPERRAADGELEGLPMADVSAEIRTIAAKWKAGETSLAVGGAEGESPEDVASRALAALTSASLLGVVRQPPSGCLRLMPTAVNLGCRRRLVGRCWWLRTHT